MALKFVDASDEYMQLRRFYKNSPAMLGQLKTKFFNARRNLLDTISGIAAKGGTNTKVADAGPGDSQIEIGGRSRRSRGLTG